MTLYEVLSSEAEVVVVGLTGRYDQALRDYSAADAYDVQSFDSTYSAYRYLEEREALHTDVQAVICDAETLVREGYLFVHNIRRDRQLRDTPIIAIDRRGDRDPAEMLRNNVDDCYRAPVSWEVLRKRIPQIVSYRQRLRSEGKSLVQDEAYEIPRGKRVFDVVFALAALAFWGIPMLVIALCIRLTSRGPVLYKNVDDPGWAVGKPGRSP